MADYGRVAGDSGKAIVTGTDAGRVANESGQAIVTGTDAGRVAGESGQAIVTPDAEFRVALMFVEVFVELYEVPLQAPRHPRGRTPSRPGSDTQTAVMGIYSRTMRMRRESAEATCRAPDSGRSNRKWSLAS